METDKAAQAGTIPADLNCTPSIAITGHSVDGAGNLTITGTMTPTDANCNPKLSGFIQNTQTGKMSNPNPAPAVASPWSMVYPAPGAGNYLVEASVNCLGGMNMAQTGITI